MADKAIGDLNFAPGTVDDSNTLFVVQQSGAAYKLSGHEFILALTTILDGHGGISDIEYTAPSSGSLEGTLTITLADQSTTELTITNGNGISSITQYFAVNNSSSSVPSSWSTTRQTMTSSNRYLWSYFHFAFNDNTSVDTPKSVIGVYGDTGDAWYIWIRYAGQQPTSDADIGTTPDDWIGIYSGTSSTAPTTYTSYTWYEFKGEKGDTGEASEVTSQSVTYAQGDYPDIIPSGGWSGNIPTVAQGKYLWTKTELVFNNDTQNPLVFYSVARMGIDGLGSVSSVNNVSPDENNNITITASDIATSDNNSIQTHVTNIESDVNNLQSDMSDAQDDIDDLQDGIIQASGYAVTGNGTSSQLSLTGLTTDHVVGNWGMFSDSGFTTPIPENAPTCDIEITTGSGYWTYTVTNFTSSFYLRPTFIKD